MLDLDKLGRGFLALALSVQASTFDGAAFIVEVGEAAILSSPPLTPLDESRSWLRELSVALHTVSFD